MLLCLCFFCLFSFIEITPLNTASQLEARAFSCDEHFVSSVTKNGSFRSPNYPNSYPSGVTCRYTFQGEGRERVRIKFTQFDLYYPSGNAHNPHECTGSDSVNIYAVINGKITSIGKHCGKKMPRVTMSNEPKLNVVFNSIHSSHSIQGFRADFSFVQNFGITTGKQDSKYVCGFNYFSTSYRKGAFMSPNYPGFYPRNTECHYLFYGQKHERVYITFTDFEVDGMGPRCQEDTHSDYIQFSNFNTKDKKMHRFCGNNLKRLPKTTVQSDMEFFKVMFKSNAIYDGKGFYAKYEFKKDPSYVDYLSNPSTNSKTSDSHSLYTHRGRGCSHRVAYCITLVFSSLLVIFVT